MNTPMDSSSDPPKLSTVLATAFFSFSLMVLLLYAGVKTISDFRIQKTALSNRQQHIAQDAADAVHHFIDEQFNTLETAVRLTDLDTQPEAQQSRILNSLLGLRSAFWNLVLLDTHNRLVARSSRLSMDASKRYIDRLQDLLPGMVGPD